MSKSNKFSPEVRERAVRMVQEPRGEYPSLWAAYDALSAVVFDFADSRGGQHARAFLRLGGEDGWRGILVCDDFSGYKACFELGVTEAGCLAHARRKFHELWANHGSPIGEQVLKFCGELYEVERLFAGSLRAGRRFDHAIELA